MFRDVLPQVKSILKKSAEESYLKDRGASYRYTQQFKMQQNVLREIGRVCVDLDVIEDEMCSIVDTIFPYLSSCQPLPLQVNVFLKN